MLLGIIILLIVAIVAYFHYAQGFFSATISAICAIIAAVVSVGYHETVIAMLMKGAAANVAQGMTLCGLFVITYVILRTIADKSVPGNVLYPLMVDKIGAGVMGVIAGLFVAGVVGLAIQSLPFGPSVAGYQRFQTVDRTVTIPGQRGNVDSGTMDELKENSMDPAKASGVFIPADTMLIGVVNTLSEGALSNEHPLTAVHPDWTTELFGQRAGVQIGTKRVLLNLPGVQMVSLKDVFIAPPDMPQIDGELKQIREGQTGLPPDKPGADEVLLVVRINFESSGTDEDGKSRVSCAAVRLVGYSGEPKVYKNYFPIGTVEDGYVILRNKPDDPLIVAGGKAADFVFKVPGADVFKDFKPKTKELEIKKDLLVWVKRMAKLDLSEKIAKGPPNSSKDVEVLRKPLEQLGKVPKRSSGGGGETSASGADVSDGPIQVTSVKVADKLMHAINPGAYDESKPDVTFKSGSGTIRDKKFAKLTIEPNEVTTALGGGDNPISLLYVPDGKKMVQVSGKTQSGSKDYWAWAALSKFELVDAGGNKYKPNGALAEVKQTGATKLVARYDAEGEVGQIETKDGRPGNVVILFNVPNGTQITGVQFEGKLVSDKGVKVP